jgi:hypothetical protein
MSIARRTSVLATLLVPLLAFGACGGDSDDTDNGTDNGPGAAGTSEEATTTTTAKASGKGKGTFTISGTEYAFDAEPCAIGGDDDQPSVEATGKGTADGKEFNVIVKRSPSEDTVIENFQLVFSLTESMVGTNFVSIPDGAANSKVKVDDKTATGTFNVIGSGGRPSGEGTVTLTCEG